jgi:hypothetical protein
MPTLSIVVCGWHFQNQNLYRALTAEAEAYSTLETHCFVASHRAADQIESKLAGDLSESGFEVVHFENEGWDWGGYHQFVHWQSNERELSDYYLFLHDDIILRKPGLLGALLERVERGAQVVGNAVPMDPGVHVRKNYPEDMLWAENNDVKIEAQRWDVVRGSCVFTTRAVVERVLMRMPIKKGGQRIELANSSLRVFAAMVADEFGPEAVAYLGTTPRESEYITEEERGGAPASLRERVRQAIPPALRRRIAKARGFSQVDPVLQGTGMKLNLGSGMDSLPGYYNIDFCSPIADFNSDIFELEFEPGSISEVIMLHVIEHIEQADMVPLFKTIHTWLRPGGQLIMEFPDLIKCCKLILDMENDPVRIQTSNLGAQGLYGGDPKTNIYDLHKWGWTGSTMSPLLREAGFSEVHVERARFHTERRDTRVVAIR